MKPFLLQGRLIFIYMFVNIFEDKVQKVIFAENAGSRNGLIVIYGKMSGAVARTAEGGFDK